MTSLYERIGGQAAVEAAVNKMYDKILSDVELAPFFSGLNTNALRSSQVEFVTYAFGGITQYKGKNLRVAHENAAKSGLNNRHFDLVAKYLKHSMIELKVPAPLIDEALAIIATTRGDVLNT